MTTFVATDADLYERSMGRWSRRLAGPFLDAALPHGAASLLDVGCGTGSLALTAAAHFPGARVVGVDVASTFLAQARTHASRPEVTFIEGDAHALPFPDASFDAVLSLLALNFLADPVQAAREMRRVTEPGGTMAAAVWDFRGGLGFLRVFADVAATLDPAADALRARLFAGPLTAPGDLAALWRDLGLSAVESGELAIRMEFRNFDDYWSPWLGGQGVVGAYAASLPADRRDRLLHHLRAAYLAGGEDGLRSFTATAWAVRGRR